MADPIIKRIDEHPDLVGVAAIADKVLGIDASQTDPAQKTVLIAMNQLSIHSPSQLAANVVGGTQIQDGAVTNSKLAADAVETAKIKNLNVTTAKLAADAVETAKIKNLNVTTAKLAADAVETAKIKNLNVTTAKLADNSVTAAKLRDSAALSVIGNSTNAVANPADIAATADGYVLRRSGTTLGFGQVVTAGIANNAVTEAKLGTIKRTLFLRVTAPDDILTVGSTTNFFPFPISLNNFIVVDARINLVVASSSGTVTVALLNQGGTMTTLSLAAGATGMSASGTISTSYRTAITNNFLGVNATAAGTGAKGLSITLVLQGVPA